MSVQHDLPVRPTWAFLMKNKMAFLGFGFGAGLAPKAQGTWGSLVGMMLAGLLLGSGLGKLGLFVLAAILFVAGIWICNETELALGRVHDYRGVVWDEIVGIMFVYALVPQGFFWWIFAFGAFRLFDIAKPQPIAFFDEKVRGGFGVMLDDVVAAVYAVLLVQFVNLFL
ncbi:phosphatidylglycerophosphatase A family protein [Alysiella filiformis]|uniref:Phosphatidylglycerophosphatase A n=1 Tax=Alysiella filiformis DSM 16848 TaxID=1120981 RepID=A0A286EAM3_9NEIS|nr:phosphatidylglycerophosphatase A [Alysiella filiformis]QMT32283.1 phosphatidylglycerophosphatase A [Alysiella filiformis]UBQ56796.1 phosphatidylglycerophosphatase A [Alysiella filiformis DSM 16848]SOD67953.1 phosphatidylglycerophosphatase A [Alysiella filiformis DSM 16848]